MYNGYTQFTHWYFFCQARKTSFLRAENEVQVAQNGGDQFAGEKYLVFRHSVTPTENSKSEWKYTLKNMFWKNTLWKITTPGHPLDTSDTPPDQPTHFPTIKICKNGKKYNFSAGAKLRRNRFSHSKTPKHAQNWLFLGIFSFFLFLRSIFWTVRT